MQAQLRRLRYVTRRLVRSPLFTAMSLLTLALAIGGNTAVFSTINSVLLKPLAFEDPEGLIGVWHKAPGMGIDRFNQSPALHFTYRDENRFFEDIGMWDPIQVTITGTDQPARAAGMRVTDGTLPLLRVRPLIGRLFTAEDDSPGTPETVILSHEYWQRQFGGSPDAVGRILTVDGRSREIIGVLSPEVQFLDYEPDIYLPFRFDLAEVFFGNFSYQAIARLRPGVTIELASQDVERMIPIAAERFPLPDGFSLAMLEEARLGANLRPLKFDVVGDVGNVLWVLLGSVGLVLLIACANVANLFLVRTEGRYQELAVRSALGASRRRLAWELLQESVILAILGGVLGLWLAWGGIHLLRALGPEGLPRLDEIAIDMNVVLFNFGISLVAGLFFGLFPILKLGAATLVSGLKEGGRGSGSGRQRHRVRNLLVVAQVALALVLLVGSGLMIRSFLALRGVHPGFAHPQEVMTLRISIPTAEIEDPVQVAATHEQILRKLEQIPGVTSVGAASAITMSGSASNDPIFVEEFPMETEQMPPMRRFKWILPGYFETMQIPLVAGRHLTWSDLHDRAQVAVITENLMREYWDDPAAALGKRIRPTPTDPWREIVGVVGNVHDDGVDQEPTKVVYWPMIMEDFWAALNDGLWVARSQAYVIRTPRVGTPALMKEVRDTVWSVNANLPLANVRTLEEILRDSMARTAFTLVLLGIAAAVALLLGIVGIYGVTSYTVSQRTREIGVRMVFGARRYDVSRLVLSQGIFLAGVGVAVGLVAAVVFTRLLSALLFGVSPLDPVTYGGVAVLLPAVALVASYLPARRAAAVDPMEALRWE